MLAHRAKELSPRADRNLMATAGSGHGRARSSARTREHVLEVTHDLFYWQGIRATGVDTVATAAEVAPTTLYRLFGSKDGLVAAYVERAADLYRNWFEDSLGSEDRPVAERLLDLFAALDDQVQPENCRGCPFLMALAELPSADHPAHRHAVAVKTWVNGRFGELVRELSPPVDDPDRLADELTLVFEGTYASAQAMGAGGPARRSRQTAAAMLRAAAT
jgi:AcrR family transcriptional regulator